MAQSEFPTDVHWDICMGRQAQRGTPFTGGHVCVDGKDIPCTAIRVDTNAQGVTMVTLTFIPGSLSLSVEPAEEN